MSPKVVVGKGEFLVDPVKAPSNVASCRVVPFENNRDNARARRVHEADGG